MLVSLLLFVAPHDGKEVEELLLQLALWKYADREFDSLAMVAVLAIEVSVLLRE